MTCDTYLLRLLLPRLVGVQPGLLRGHRVLQTLQVAHAALLVLARQLTLLESPRRALVGTVHLLLALRKLALPPPQRHLLRVHVGRRGGGGPAVVDDERPLLLRQPPRGVVEPRLHLRVLLRRPSLRRVRGPLLVRGVAERVVQHAPRPRQRVAAALHLHRLDGRPPLALVGPQLRAPPRRCARGVDVGLRLRLRVVDVDRGVRRPALRAGVEVQQRRRVRPAGAARLSPEVPADGLRQAAPLRERGPRPRPRPRAGPTRPPPQPPAVSATRVLRPAVPRRHRRSRAQRRRRT